MPKRFVRVHHEDHEASAEVVAAGLRAQGIPAAVERDDDLLAITGPLSRGRFAIVVPDRQSRRARRALGEPLEPRSRGAGPYVTAALLFGMLAAAVVYVVSRLL
ncbi:MAG: hypothetical protein ABR525_02395 [Candidatus Limnocylindria bacterium]